MLDPDFLTSEDRAFLETCYNAGTAAVEMLNSLTAAHPVCQYLLSSAERGDAQAHQTLFRTAFGSPLQREWVSRRNIHAANWTKRLNGQVETVYRARLRSVPNEVEDGVQEFWIWFFAEEKDLQYRPERAAEETYVKVLANFRAMQHLKRTVIRRVRFVEADDQELDRAATHVQPQYPTGPDVHSTFAAYVYRLILTNELAPHEAILLMAGVVAGLGPTILAQQYSNSTLSQICDLIHSALSLPEDACAMAVVSALRDQLLLPIERSLGERRLSELAAERNRSGNDRRHSERSLEEVFQYWTDQAKRVCKRGHQCTDRDRLSKEIVQHMDQKLRTRLHFLTQTLTENKPEAEKLLVWAWRKILNMPLEYFSGLSGGQAAKTLVERARHLCPDFPVPADLRRLLAGAAPEETLRRRLETLGLDAVRVERLLENKYRAYLAAKEICL